MPSIGVADGENCESRSAELFWVQAEVVAAIQAELTATIDNLANSVRHLALRAKLTESIVDAREAERSAEALRIAAWATEEVEPQLSMSV